MLNDLAPGRGRFNVRRRGLLLISKGGIIIGDKYYGITEYDRE